MKKMLTFAFAGAVLTALTLGAESNGQESTKDKWFQVSATNEEPAFMLRVDVDKPDRVYREGDKMVVTVTAEKDCYLYLYYYSGENVATLFPNQFQTENFIRGGQQVSVPSKEAKFNITCTPPFGQEVLHVVATLQKKDESLAKAMQIVAREADVQRVAQQLEQQDSSVWAEAKIDITTMPRKGKVEQKQRLAVCVGISQFKNERVPDLRVSHADAERMAQILRKPGPGQVDDVVLLQNEEATRAAIRKAIFEDLPSKSKPGDEVIIYFSCHGGRMADTNGDEDDGYDEYLMPHDGEIGKEETVILDDTFARWLQQLDGRRIAVIMDNCYSGGTSKGFKFRQGSGRLQDLQRLQKGLPSPASVRPGDKVDFFDGEVGRTKDLGQTGTMVLAACQASEVAWEMPSEDAGSVLTHYILESLTQDSSDLDGNGRITMDEVYEYIKQPVQQYVQQQFGGEQTPVLIDNATEKVALRP